MSCKIVCIGKDDDHIFDRLRVTGMRVEKEDSEGNKIRREDQIENCLTPSLLLSDGDVVLTTDVSDEFVDKIPTEITPNFGVVWREDDFTYPDGEGGFTQHPWPEFEVDVFDEFGAVTGTKMQCAGRII